MGKLGDLSVKGGEESPAFLLGGFRGVESCLPPTPDVVVGPGGPVPGLGLAQRAGPQAVSPTAGQARGGGGPLHSHPQCCARPCTRATGPPAASSQSLGVSAPPPGAGPVLRPCGPATRGGSCSVTLGLDTLGFRQGRAGFLMRALLEGKAAAGPVARVPSRRDRWEVCALHPRPAWGPAQPLPGAGRLPGVLSPTSLPARQPCG